VIVGVKDIFNKSLHSFIKHPYSTTGVNRWCLAHCKWRTCSRSKDTKNLRRDSNPRQ